MGVRRDLRLDETAHLGPHLLGRLVEARVSELEAPVLLRHELDEAGASRSSGLLPRFKNCRGPGEDPVARRSAQGRDRQGGQSPSGSWGCRRRAGSGIRRGGRDQEPLHLAEAARRLEPLRPAEHLAQRLDVGGAPRQPVRGGLRLVEVAGRRHLSAHRGLGMMQKALGGRDSLLEPLKFA